MLNINSEKGISILYAVFIVSILLATAFGLSIILVDQIQMIGEMGYSVVALYAADSGIEQTLMNRDNPSSIPLTELSDGISYQVFVLTGGTDGCDEKYNYCIKSIGFYRGTRRAIEVSY